MNIEIQFRVVGVLMFKLIAVLIALFFPLSQLMAQVEAPTSGLLYGVKENRGLRYECSQLSDGRLQCDFVQSNIRLKKAPEDWPLEQASAEAEWDKMDAEDSAELKREACEGSAMMLPILKGEQPAPDLDQFAAISEVEKASLLDTAMAMENFCIEPNKENWMEFKRIIFVQDTRTCEIAADTWSQTFKPQSSRNQSIPVWIIDDSVSGECGVLRLDRWEVDNSLEFPMWNYTSRKAVNNPAGTLGLGISCSGLDEDEYPYVWRSRSISMQCDRINVSVF